jgi:hypothetical protein
VAIAKINTPDIGHTLTIALSESSVVALLVFQIMYSLLVIFAIKKGWKSK